MSEDVKHKLESIISGHSINEDDAAWLRGLLSREPHIEVDFKQATELLEMFAGEPTSITLMPGNGHSGEGLYAYYTDLPGEGATFLGVADDDASPLCKQCGGSGIVGSLQENDGPEMVCYCLCDAGQAAMLAAQAKRGQ